MQKFQSTVPKKNISLPRSANQNKKPSDFKQIFSTVSVPAVALRMKSMQDEPGTKDAANSHGAEEISYSQFARLEARRLCQLPWTAEAEPLEHRTFLQTCRTCKALVLKDRTQPVVIPTIWNNHRHTSAFSEHVGRPSFFGSLGGRLESRAFASADVEVYSQKQLCWLGTVHDASDNSQYALLLFFAIVAHSFTISPLDSSCLNLLHANSSS